MNLERLEVTCTDYTHDGMGVARHDNFAIFIKGLLAGERAIVEIETMKKRYAIANIVEILEASPHRVQPICAHHEVCGGCQLLHFSGEEQINFKKKQFRKFDPEIFDYHPTDHPFHYRNKAIFHLQRVEDEWKCGYFKQKTHAIFALENCHLITAKMNELQLRLVYWLNFYQVETDLFKVMIRESELNGQLMLCLFSDKITDDLKIIMDHLIVEFEQMTSVYFYTSRNKKAMMHNMDKKQYYCQAYIDDKVFGLDFQVSPDSFLQVNRFQTNHLYQTVIDLAGLKKNHNVLELYCGIGTISLAVASYVDQVVAIEVVASAIEDAKENATINNIENVTFIQADAKQYECDQAFDLVIVDPPRKGLDDSVVDKLIEIASPKIIYVSCDIQTQLRDIEKMMAAGYKVVKVDGHDMFSQSYHVESVVLLEK